jgi:uncharacterized protein (TIGR02145 family)
VAQIAAGAYHSLALASDDPVYSWGSDSNGQLGDNSSGAKPTPVAVYMADIDLGPYDFTVKLDTGYCTDLNTGTNNITTNFAPDGSWVKCKTPAHVEGEVDVTVNNGVKAVTLAKGYTYRNPMTIDSVSPSYDTEKGGATVAITGTNIMPVVPPAPTTMQEMTQEYCASMAVYDGTNPSAILILNDPRGVGQNYQVAKLADNNCWMLNNLKLGSLTGPTNLTPADTNIGANWALPRLNEDLYGFETPYAYALVTGQPGFDDTLPNAEETNINSPNFAGYHYNWCAATAGDPSTCTESTVKPADATYDICPANWRLPRGGQEFDPDNEFDQLSAKMAGYDGNQDINYQDAEYGGPEFADNFIFDGPFKAVLAGSTSSYDGGSWDYHGVSGHAWSASGPWHPSIYSRNSASLLTIYHLSEVSVNDQGDRNAGFSVRCMASGGASSALTVTFDTGANAVQATNVSATDNGDGTETIKATVPAHAPGLVSVTVDNGIDQVVTPATCNDGQSYGGAGGNGGTACNGRLDSGESRGEDRSHVNSGFLYEEVYLELSSSLNPTNTLTIPVTPGGATPTVGTASHQLYTRTNNPTGYSLAIRTTNSGSRLTHATNPSFYLDPVGGTLAAPLDISLAANVNTWGYSLTNPNTALGACANYCYTTVPTTSTTVKQYTQAHEGSATNPSEPNGNPTAVYYGVSVNTTKINGNYQATVVYVVAPRL